MNVDPYNDERWSPLSDRTAQREIHPWPTVSAPVAELLERHNNHVGPRSDPGANRHSRTPGVAKAGVQLQKAVTVPGRMQVRLAVRIPRR